MTEKGYLKVTDGKKKTLEKNRENAKKIKPRTRQELTM